MTDTYEFVEATPTKRTGRQGAGRRPEPNPFHDAVKAIIGQVNGDGDPVARAVSFDLDAEHGETVKQRKGRIRRFLTRAAKEIAGEGNQHAAINLAVDANPGTNPALKGAYVATFWDRDAGK